MEKECHCANILSRSNGGIIRVVYLHLYGCQAGYEYEEYEKLKWWKKIFKPNPYKNYVKYHLIQKV